MIQVTSQFKICNRLYRKNLTLYDFPIETNESNLQPLIISRWLTQQQSAIEEKTDSTLTNILMIKSDRSEHCMYGVINKIV